MFAQLIIDGWKHRYVNGILFRSNPDHIQRCITAIRQRHEAGDSFRVEEPKAHIIQLRKKV